MSAGTLSGLQHAGGLLEGSHETREPDGVEGLCDRFADVCESAVDPLEIAAALEFDGLNDQIVQVRYNFRDVFAIAEEMHRRVPVRPAEPPEQPEPWQQSGLRPVLHGVIYALPAICFPAAAGLLSGRGSIIVLLVSMLVSWATSQGLAHVGYVRLGKGDPAQTKRVLRYGLLAGVTVVGVCVAVAGTLVLAPRTALVFGLGQGMYMLGATVLMVLRTEQLLLLVLAPGCLGSAGFLLLGRPVDLEPTAWVLLAVTPVLAVATALWLTRGRVTGAGWVFAPAELRAAVPSAVFGLLAAALIAFPVVPGWGADRAGASTGALLSALPLSLSMGAAEWSLFWYRRKGTRLLKSTGSLRRFARRARLFLLTALTQYLLATIVLIAAVVAIATTTELVVPEWTFVPQLGVYVALGGAMFVALLLQSMGVRFVPLLACGVALVALFAGRDLGVAGQITAMGGLLVFLTGYAVAALGSAIRHV